jgi:hypothetical protein
MQLKVGAPLSKTFMRGCLNLMVDFYRKNGANLSVQPEITPSNGTATIKFHIDETGTKGIAGRYEPNGGNGGSNGPPPSSK